MFVHNSIVMFEQKLDTCQMFVELLVKHVEAFVDGTEASIDGVEARVHSFFELCDRHASAAAADHSIVEMRRRCRAVEV
jgi:hypothetical protein